MNNYIFLPLLFILFFNHAATQTRYKLPCDTARDAWEGRICAGEEFKKADEELNDKYQLLLKKIRALKASLGVGDVDSLQEASIERLIVNTQQKWLEYRDSACAIRGKMWEGGSGLSEAVSTIGTQLTRERILEIEDLLSYYKHW